ncbi:hypothetical protein KBD71_04490 [Candidatus Woesebacteria bacterium]|nr:hypothetical protein [Candidatus Woesebacteria bacterium]
MSWADEQPGEASGSAGCEDATGCSLPQRNPDVQVESEYEKPELQPELGVTTYVEH